MLNELKIGLSLIGSFGDLRIPIFRHYL